MVRYRKGIIVLGVVLLCVLGVILVRERLMKSSPLEKLEKSVGSMIVPGIFKSADGWRRRAAV